MPITIVDDAFSRARRRDSSLGAMLTTPRAHGTLGKIFSQKRGITRNHVAQSGKICTTTIQIFPELMCVGSCLSESDEASFEIDFSFCSGWDLLGATRDFLTYRTLGSHRDGSCRNFLRRTDRGQEEEESCTQEKGQEGCPQEKEEEVAFLTGAAFPASAGRAPRHRLINKRDRIQRERAVRVHLNPNGSNVARGSG